MLLIPSDGELVFHGFVAGVPAPKGSKKHIGGGRMAEVSPRLPAWDKALDEALAAHPCAGELVDGPLRVDYLFVMPHNKGHFKAGGELKDNAPYWHITMPDKDKLERAVGDALTRNGVIKDDARIADSGTIRKIYGRDTGVHIWIWRLPAGEPAAGKRALRAEG